MLSPGGIPNDDGPIAAAGRQARAIREEGQRIDTAALSVPTLESFTGVRLEEINVGSIAETFGDP